MRSGTRATPPRECRAVAPSGPREAGSIARPPARARSWWGPGVARSNSSARCRRCRPRGPRRTSAAQPPRRSERRCRRGRAPGPSSGANPAPARRATARPPRRSRYMRHRRAGRPCRASGRGAGPFATPRPRSCAPALAPARGKGSGAGQPAPCRSTSRSSGVRSQGSDRRNPGPRGDRSSAPRCSRSRGGGGR